MESGCSDMMRPFAPWDGMAEAWASLWAAWEIKAGLGTVFAAFCSFLDIDEKMLSFVCVALVGDFILGMIDAFRRNHFRCRVVAFGMTKIFWYIVYLTIVGLLNRAFSEAITIRLPLLDLFVAYLVASDCISMTGHLHSMGVPVPPLLTAIAYKIRKKSEKSLKKIIDDADPLKKELEDGE